MVFKRRIVNMKNIFFALCFFCLIGCGGSILDVDSLGTKKIEIQGISVTSGSTTASIIWTTDIPSNHQILYGTSSGSYTMATAVSTVGSTTHQVDLSDLVTDSVYYYKIVCNAESFDTSESAEYSFSTSSAIDVNSLEAELITTTSADITWTTNVATTHIVEYGTSAGSYTQSTIQSGTASTSHTVSLAGLSSGVTYYFRVKNFHSTLPYAVSTELSFITAGMIIVSGISEISTDSSITVSWTTNYPTTHSINYGMVSGSLASSTSVSGIPSTSHSVAITGLSMGRTYYYQINNIHSTLGSVTEAERSCSTTPTLAQKTRGIWLVGGLSGTQATSVITQMDLFDPVTLTWYTNIASNAAGTYVPVSFAAVESYKRPSDGHHLIIVIGGFDSTGLVRNLVQIYDIEDDSWSNGSVIPAARAGITAARVYDKIFIMGGTSNNASAAWNGNTTSYEYTIGSSWNTRTAVTAVTERFLYPYNDVVYHIGGRSAAGAVATQAHEGYSVTGLAVTGSTEVVMSTARTGVAGSVWVPSNGPAKILLIGGYSAFTGTPTACIVENAAITVSTSQNLFQYLNYPFVSPSAWVACTAYPLTVGFGSSAVYGSVLYHFGGTVSVVTSPTRLASGSAAVYSTDLTTLPSNTWTSVTSMPIGRYGHAAVTLQQ